MRTMALNTARENQNSVGLSQILHSMAKSIVELANNENTVAIIAVLCTLVVLLGVVMLQAVVIAIGVSMLVVAVAPIFYKWCKEDVNRDI